MKGELLKHAKQKNENWYPWTEKDIETGILERSYVEHLSATCPWHRLLLSEAGVGITCFPDFARNTIKYQALPFQQMEALETVFKRFRENSEDYVHAFVIGQTSHWLTIIVNKVNQTVETMLLDSKNRFILGLTKEEITDEIMHRLQKQNKLDYPQWKIDVAISTRLDTQYSLQLFHNCAMGLQNIKHQLFDSFVEGFFELYDGATLRNSEKIQKQEIPVAEDDGTTPRNSEKILKQEIPVVEDDGTTPRNSEKLLKQEIPVAEDDGTTPRNSEKIQKQEIPVAEDDGTTTRNSEKIQKHEIPVVEEDEGQFLVDFVNWLENYSPPALIEQNMISLMENLGVHSISDHNWNRFHIWSEEIRRRIDMENCNIPVVSRFKETHAWFERTFFG